MTSQDKVVIFDTTLRDGEQSPGATMTHEEKLEIAGLLDVSDRTVKRRWRSARAFLFQDLAAQGIST